MTARWTEADLRQLRRNSQPEAPRPPVRKTRKVDAADLFPHFCELHGLPKPEIEARGLVPGRKFRVDYLFREARIVIERNGQIWKQGGHSSGAGLLGDYEKVNLLQLEGFRVFQFTPDQMFKAETIAILKQAMA